MLRRDGITDRVPCSDLGDVCINANGCEKDADIFNVVAFRQQKHEHTDHALEYG